MVALTFSHTESTPAMRLYLDTADQTAWAEWMPSGVFYGITTNPLLAARAGLTYDQINWQDLVQIAADAGAQEFHAQVIGNETVALRFAENLYAYGASVRGVANWMPSSMRRWANTLPKLSVEIGVT